MAGNNRTTVWNMNTARGFLQSLGSAMVILAIAWTQFAHAEGATRLRQPGLVEDGTGGLGFTRERGPDHTDDRGLVYDQIGLQREGRASDHAPPRVHLADVIEHEQRLGHH